MDTSTSSVAVILATYNRAHLIGEAIDSLLNQTRPPDEFYIIDDGSTDDTRRVVGAYGDRVTLISQPNGGRAAAFNRVIPDIGTDYIWLFDDDDIALPHALETHLAFLQANPDYDFSYSTHYFFETQLATHGDDANSIARLPDVPSDQFFLWLMNSHFAPTQLQGMLIPTECYRTVGLFDEELLRSQDIDMMLRIARHFRAGRIDTPTWAFRQHDGPRGPGARRQAMAKRYDVWRSYNLRVFGKLRADVTLAEYLHPLRESAASRPWKRDTAHRRALLQRAVVMSIHGLDDAAIDDFLGFCAELSSAAHPLSALEKRQVSQLSYIHNAAVMRSTRYFYRLGRGTQRSRPLLMLTLRGVYWSVLREARARRVRTALTMTPAFAVLLAGFVIPDPG